MSHLLGIDIGTSGTKTLICNRKGKVLATATAEHDDQRRPSPAGRSRTRPSGGRRRCAATKKVLKKAKIKGTQVSGIGLSGQMHGSVFIGDDGPEPPCHCDPALLWNDQRTVKECVELEKAAGSRKKLIEMTGNPALTGFHRAEDPLGAQA
jgi:xylulokinase